MTKNPQDCPIDPEDASRVLREHLKVRSSTNQVTHDDRIYRLERQVKELQNEIRDLLAILEIGANDDVE